MNRIVFVLCILGLGPSLPGQQTGPVISDFGAVYEVKTPDFPTDPDHAYRVIFDITRGETDPATLNQSLNTIARFLNMHAQAGVPLENLHAVAVIHSTATHSILSDQAYRKRYNTDNPNLPLFTALKKAGVQLFVCGQSLHARDVAREEVSDYISVALSAMTVLIQKQNEGFGLIGW